MIINKKRLNNEKSISPELEIKSIDSSLLMSATEIFAPIIGEWQTKIDEVNNIIGDIDIKCFPLMGNTLFTPLRRIILGFSSAYGVAAIKITNNNESPLHIFAPIMGIAEDLPYIHANIKNIKIKVSFENDDNEHILKYFFLTLTTNKPGPVYARDIKIDTEENSDMKIEIINPDHIICNLDVGSNLKIEILFRQGFSYASEDDNQKYLSKFLPSSLREGWFYVGTQFSNGVLSCVGEVTEVTGGSIPYDLLQLKIVTDGRVLPHDALENAFRILHEQIPSECCTESTNGSKNSANANEETSQDTLLSNIGLQPGTLNQLERNGITTLHDLLKQNPQSLKILRGFGNTRLNDVVKILNSLGLSLKD